MIVWTGVNVPTDACTITPPVMAGVELFAVKVTVATPFTVLPWEADSVPAHGQMDVIAKFTTVPSVTGLFRTFRTVAVTVVVLPVVRFGLATLKVMDAGLLVIIKLVDAGASAPVVPWMVTAPDEAPE